MNVDTRLIGKPYQHDFIVSGMVHDLPAQLLGIELRPVQSRAIKATKLTDILRSPKLSPLKNAEERKGPIVASPLELIFERNVLTIFRLYSVRNESSESNYSISF